MLALTRVYWRLLAIAPPRERGLLAPAPWPVLSPSARVLYEARDGGVAERLKAHAWKVCMRETVSRVRIPPPPPAYVSDCPFVSIEVTPNYLS
jgi:hypothetical protein